MNYNLIYYHLHLNFKYNIYLSFEYYLNFNPSSAWATVLELIDLVLLRCFVTRYHILTKVSAWSEKAVAGPGQNSGRGTQGRRP